MSSVCIAITTQLKECTRNICKEDPYHLYCWQHYKELVIDYQNDTEPNFVIKNVKVSENHNIIKDIYNLFTLDKQFTRGANGTVYEATNKITHQKVALKRIISDVNHVRNVLNEIQVWKYISDQCNDKLNQCGLVRIHDYYHEINVDRKTNYIYISMALYSDGDSTNLIKKYNSNIWIYNYTIVYTTSHLVFLEKLIPELIPAITTLNYMHQLKILHRDIKPENLLYNGNTHRLLIGDFGASCENQKCQNKTTTPMYQDPRTWTCGSFDVYSDIYALGMTCFNFLFLYYYLPVFIKTKNYQKLKSLKVWETNYQEDIVPQCQRLLKYIPRKNKAHTLLIAVQMMLNPNHEERPSLSSLLEALDKNNINLLKHDPIINFGHVESC